MGLLVNNFKVACIGSRQITPELATLLKKVGEFIVDEGGLIASGNAIGSDAAFAAGGNLSNPNRVELYLPWATYNHELLEEGNRVVLDEAPSWEPIARKHHPIYDELPQGAKKMMCRNVGIVKSSNVTLAVLNHERVGWGGTWHGWNVSADLGRPRMDVSSLGKEMELQEIKDWLVHYSKLLNAL